MVMAGKRVVATTCLRFGDRFISTFFLLTHPLFNVSQINAFIHCFVETRKITSLYDMQIAICKNEGIERFEELELGPFLQYPLVMHYFSLNSDMTEVLEITSEEIVCLLAEFFIKRKSGKCKSRKPIEIEDLLSFIAKEKSVSGTEKLGVRIRNLGCVFFVFNMLS